MNWGIVMRFFYSIHCRAVDVMEEAEEAEKAEEPEEAEAVEAERLEQVGVVGNPKNMLLSM